MRGVGAQALDQRSKVRAPLFDLVHHFEEAARPSAFLSNVRVDHHRVGAFVTGQTGAIYRLILNSERKPPSRSKSIFRILIMRDARHSQSDLEVRWSAQAVL